MFSLSNLFLPKEPVWVLNEDTLNLVRAVEQVAKECDLHVALGGSVLHKGKSFKDLDFFVYPHTMEAITRRDLHYFADALRNLGITGWSERSLVTVTGYEVKRVFFTAQHNGRRIEFFVLNCPEYID
jgi:hypothetical protein